MSFRKVDNILNEWASRHSLTLFTKYREEEVRSVELVSPSCKRFQLWVDPPVGESVMVHIWDFKKRRMDWSVSISTLDDCLENALAIVFDWIVKA